MQNMQNTKTVRVQHITLFLYSEFHEANLNHQETIIQNMQNMQKIKNTKTVRIQHITVFLYSEFHEENLNHQETNGE